MGKPTAETRPAATPEAGHLVSAGIRAMVPGWIVEMVEDEPGDALALTIAYMLGDLPPEKRAALLRAKERPVRR